MNIKNNQTGIAHLAAIVIVVVLAGVGFVGYRVFTAQNAKDSGENTGPTADAQVWTAGGIAIPGTYADADVVQVSDTQWRLYYSIQPEVQGHNFEVYSATSTDGKTWAQEAGVRSTMATFPDVVKLKDGRYRMYTQQAGVIKSSISSDGLSFTAEAGTRIDTANPDNLVFDNVAAPSVAELDDGTFAMLYRGTINTRYAANTPNPTTQLLLWATSTDGLTFTKKGIAIDSRNTTLNGQLDGPDLVRWDDGTYRVYAASYTGVYEFSFDGTMFGDPALALAGEAKQDNMGFHGSPPGDPTTANIGGTWYMYYGGPREQNGIHFATLQ